MRKDVLLLTVLAVANVVAAAACSVPTLAQRQDKWRRVMDVTRAECMVGQADPAMPTDVRQWCAEVTAP